MVYRKSNTATEQKIITISMSIKNSALEIIIKTEQERRQKDVKEISLIHSILYGFTTVLWHRTHNVYAKL